MPDVEILFWRGITSADFFNIERARIAGPTGGGGQSYISISFRGLSHEDLGRFLQLSPPSLIGTTRPTVSLQDVAVIDDPSVTGSLEFAPRYQPPQADDRYRISKQNRQFQHRHPAWVAARRFPKAPDDVAKRDPRIPDLTHLKIFVIRLDDGTYRAGFANTSKVPAGLVGIAKLSPLFLPYDESNSAGVIDFDSGEVPVEVLAAATESLAGDAPKIAAATPEVFEATESTRIAAGKRPSGQGYRLNADQRRAVELRAMDLAQSGLEAEGWTVVDVSATRPFDFLCNKGGNEMRVEVKGTTGDGSSVLLTPGEVKHAREGHALRLIVVKGIALRLDDNGAWVAEGGEVNSMDPWDLDATGELFPTGYEYKL